MKNNDQNKKLVRGFTLEELAKFDGRNGKPCYVAVEGKVYDLSGSPLWLEGNHINCEDLSICGQDLTKVVREDAPESHEEGHYKEFPVVGELE